MRRPRSRSEDFDAVDVLIVEDDDGDDDVAADEFLTLLHELALESLAWRATWPGESRQLPGSDTAVAQQPLPSLAQRLVKRYRWRAVTVAVLAVAVAATTAVMDARQTAARAAALAAKPVVLAEATTPPAEVWRLPGRVASAHGDRLLMVDGASLRAIDPRTGVVVWTAPAAAGHAASAGGCFPVDEGLMPGRTPLEDDAGPRGLVACVADAPGGTSPPGDATAGDVVVVDSMTGRITHTVAVDGPPLLAEPVDRDLLVADSLADGRIRVTRWDLATGTPRWDSVSPRPVLTDGAAPATVRRPNSLTVGEFAVDLATGAQLGTEPPGRALGPDEAHTLPGGARATWSWREDGTLARGHVRGGDAGWSYGLPGPPLRPSVTDDSDPVLVVRTADGDRLRGLDLRTGRLEWTRPYPGASALRSTALVDGVMLLDEGSTVTALDLRTGTTTWRAEVDAEVSGEVALTDGRVVLLPVRADDGTLHLVACRIADGAEVWRTEVPAGVISLTVVDHHLVASTDAEVIGLG